MSVPSSSFSRRLARLRHPDGFFFLLALDHGLTSGPIPGLPDVRAGIALADRLAIPAVVLNPGSAALLPPESGRSLVLQLVGVPRLAKNLHQRVPIASVADSLRLAADAVSVQIDYASDRLPDVLPSIGQILSDAREWALPVMVMVSRPTTSYGYEHLHQAIRVTAELGASIIKVALPDDRPSPRVEALTRRVIAASPPVVLAGGPHSAGFHDQITLASALGFSGVCIGRNLFQSQRPSRFVSRICRAFRASRRGNPWGV